MWITNGWLQNQKQIWIICQLNQSINHNKCIPDCYFLFYNTWSFFFVNVDFKQFSIKPWDSFIHFLSDFLPIKAVTIIHSEPGGGDTFFIFPNNSFVYKLKLIKNLKYLNQKTLFSLKTINKLIYYRRNRQKWNL